jgi:hypothetical protein
MKYSKLILTALMAASVALVSLPAIGAPEWSVWSGGGTDVSTTLCYSVVSARGKNGGVPVITYLSATSDKAGSVVQFYTASNAVTVQAANTTVTIPLSGSAITNVALCFNTNGGIVVIEHKATDTYERRILGASGSDTNLVVTSAPTVALAAGDVIYPMYTAGSIPVGNATLGLGPGDGIYSGQAGRPLLLEVDGTSACQINAVSAKFVP